MEELEERVADVQHAIARLPRGTVGRQLLEAIAAAVRHDVAAAAAARRERRVDHAA